MRQEKEIKGIYTGKEEIKLSFRRYPDSLYRKSQRINKETLGTNKELYQGCRIQD